MAGIFRVSGLRRKALTPVWCDFTYPLLFKSLILISHPPFHPKFDIVVALGRSTPNPKDDVFIDCDGRKVVFLSNQESYVSKVTYLLQINKSYESLERFASALECRAHPIQIQGPYLSSFQCINVNPTPFPINECIFTP
jgi:hypothetical protein